MKLYAWQEEAILRAKTLTHLALLADMGVGKTAVAVNIIRDKWNSEKRAIRTLILGPSSVIYNWKAEILKFSKIDKKNIFVSSGSGGRRVDKLRDFLAFKREAIVITNYESFRNKDLFAAILEWKPEILIADESHQCKNPTSLQSKAVFQISKEAKYRYILTGTPILNSPMDIFMQYKILDQGESFGTNFFVFRNKYFRDKNEYWKGKQHYFPAWEPIKELFPELTARIYAKAVRVRKSDCLDLPERIEMIRYVELSKDQKRMYTEMSKNFIAFVNENKENNTPIVAQLALTKALKLQQIATGFVIDEEGKAHDLGDNPRLKAVETLLEEIIPENKCILWCCFKEHYQQLGKLCGKMGIKHVFITGEQDAKEKQEAILDFQKNPETRVIIANRRAGGTGINLVEASYSIIYGRNFSLAEEKQSQDRNYRAGSEIHKCITKIDLCAKDTIDEKIIEALRSKQDVSTKIIDFVTECLQFDKDDDTD